MEAKYLISIAAWAGFLKFLGPIYGTLAVIFLITIIALLSWTLRRSRDLKQIADRLENVYIVERPGGRWIQLKFERDNPGLVIYADPGQVNATVEKYLRLLKKSGNKRDLKVFVYRFQHGEFCNEDDQEYITRLEYDIGEKRIEQHSEYKKDIRFYMRAHHLEPGAPVEAPNVYEWDVTRKE